MCIGCQEEDESIIWNGDFVYRLPTDKGLTIGDIVDPLNPSMPFLSDVAIKRLDTINARAKERGLGYKDCKLTLDQKFLNLDANFFKGADGKRGVIVQDDRLRMPTPLECERLQTVPPDFTNHVSNTQRYRMLGNGWTVDVVAHILNSYN